MKSSELCKGKGKGLKAQKVLMSAAAADEDDDEINTRRNRLAFEADFYSPRKLEEEITECTEDCKLQSSIPFHSSLRLRG